MTITSRRPPQLPARAGVATLGFVALLMFAPGCGSRVSGSPQPAPTSSHATASDPPAVATTTAAASSAPTVEHPLDASSYLPNPCGLLAKPQMASFGYRSSEEPKFHKDEYGPACTWFDDTRKRQPMALTVLLLTADKNGLSTVYDIHSGSESFEPTTVSNYPAAFWTDKYYRDAGACELFVGVNDHLAFGVIVDGDPHSAQKTRAVAKRAAAAVVRTLQGGA